MHVSFVHDFQYVPVAPSITPSLCVIGVHIGGYCHVAYKLSSQFGLLLLITSAFTALLYLSQSQTAQSELEVQAQIVSHQE
jgi:hypothetical protein